MTISYAEVPAWLQWIIVLTIIAGAIMALIGLVWKAWPVLTRFVATINSLGDLPQFMVTTAATLAGQDDKIAEIHKEVNYNGGGSVKDSQVRTERDVAELKTYVEGIDAGVKGLYAQRDREQEKK